MIWFDNVKGMHNKKGVDCYCHASMVRWSDYL